MGKYRRTAILLELFSHQVLIPWVSSPAIASSIAPSPMAGPFAAQRLGDLGADDLIHTHFTRGRSPQIIIQIVNGSICHRERGFTQQTNTIFIS